MKKHHTEEQILGILKEAEQGKPLPDVLRQQGIASGTFIVGRAATADWSQASSSACGNSSERTMS